MINYLHRNNSDVI